MATEVVLAIRPIGASSRLISAFLAAYCVWVGVVFCWAFYSQTNDHAVYYGAMFVLQGVLWFVAGVALPQPSQRASSRSAS